MNFFPTAYDPTSGIAYGAGIEGCSDLSVDEVAAADVDPGTIFVGGAAANNGVVSSKIRPFERAIVIIIISSSH